MFTLDTNDLPYFPDYKTKHWDTKAKIFTYIKMIVVGIKKIGGLLSDYFILQF